MRLNFMLIAALALCSSYTCAMNTVDLRQLYNTGQHKEAIARTLNYLQSCPNDGDVRLVLAQFYFAEKKYQQARLELLTILKQTPSNTDAMLVLINCDIALLNYQEASFMANFGLVVDPLNADLQKKRGDITYLLTSVTPPQMEVVSSPQVLESQLTAIELQTITHPPEYQRIKTLYAQGQHQPAIQQAIEHLKLYPQDVDIRLVLGQFYFLQKQYTKAEQQEKQVLQQVPQYKDAMFVLINVYIQLKQLDKAKALIKQGLVYYPKDALLQKKIQDIKTIQHPSPKPLKLPETKSKAPEYLNEIGIYQQNYYVSDVKQTWDYSTLFYARETELGKMYAKISYNDRLGFKAIQEEIEIFPQIDEYLYLDIQGAIANEPNLFPDYLAGGELYASIPEIFDFSGGGKYNYIDSLHQFTLYTGSIAKQYGKHRFSYRTNFYSPSSGESSLLNLLDYRYFIQAPKVYVGVIYGQGTSPDLANLVTVDFLVTDNKIFSPYLNFTLFNERLIINASFYYQHQVFSELQRVRNWTGGTLRLTWKY